MGFSKRNPSFTSVEDIVKANTGMTKEELLCDSRSYAVTHLSEAEVMIRDQLISGDGVFIFGDYDVDGITSTRILQDTFVRYACNSYRVWSRLPKRFTEGYGAKPDAIREHALEGRLLILVDNGIKCFDAVKAAKECGMKVVILDHHEPEIDSTGEPVLPEADVIVDPKVFHGDFDQYCGAGLALKLVEALANDPEMMQRTCSDADHLIRKAKALAALGTVCDQVPLVGENRRIVREGLEIINDAIASNNDSQELTMGLFALIQELGIEQVTEKNIGFKIGPCINAWGRLEDEGAAVVANYLKYDRYKSRAKLHAEEIIARNELRKELSEKWYDAATDYITNCRMENDYPIVLHLAGMPEGIAGLIAGRIAEAYETPSFIFSDTPDKDVIKGSARSDGNVDINALLSKHSDLMIVFGGHKGAAGLSIHTVDIGKFRETLQKDLGQKPVVIKGDTCYDLEISPADIPNRLQDVLLYGPYGEGNPAPEFLVRGLMAIPDGGAFYKELAKNGVKIQVANAACITFDASDKFRQLGAPKRFDAVGTLGTNVFRGNITTQLEFTDVEPAEAAVRSKSPLLMALERKAVERSA